MMLSVRCGAFFEKRTVHHFSAALSNRKKENLFVQKVSSWESYRKHFNMKSAEVNKKCYFGKKRNCF